MQMDSEQQEMLQDDVSEMQARQRALDAAISQVDEEIAAVEAGTHPELLRSCRKLQQAREKREKAAQQTYEAELLTLERLHELEMEAAQKQLERGLEMAREKILDQMIAKAKLAEARREGKDEDGVRMSTRSLRSKVSGNDDAERTTGTGGRRTTTRRGAQSPASMLLEKTLSEAAMEADFQSIADQQPTKKRNREVAMTC